MIVLKFEAVSTTSNLVFNPFSTNVPLMDEPVFSNILLVKTNYLLST